jgi:Beta-propeller repeat/Abnormal spindle-like microcephaly-assoc'd, ASPM-SPD-2-Hydin
MKPLCFLGICLFAASLFSQTNEVPAARQSREAGASANASHPDAKAQAAVLEGYGRLPLSFERNQGQVDRRVKFFSRGAGYALFLTSEGATLSLTGHAALNGHAGKVGASEGDDASGIPAVMAGGAPPRVSQQTSAVLRMQLLGARGDAAVLGVDELSSKTNYFRGDDPKKWTTNVANYAKVRYREVFEGVDLVYYGNRGQLEYDFVVSAGAAPEAIRFAFTGARKVRVDQRTGDLVLTAGSNGDEVRFQKPVAYQTGPSDAAQPAGSGKRLVDARYVLDARNRVSFELGPYDHNRTLLIDPTLSYSTYLGGSSNDYGTSIAVDAAGNAYVTGFTNSTNFPVTSGALQTSCGGGCSGTSTDAFVAKLDATGSSLIYSTYLGGSGNDQSNGIALDAAGDAYIVGQTFSTDFPTTPGAFQPSCRTDCAKGDAFVAELNPEGSALIYSTHLGGSAINQGNAIALDAAGNAYVTGYTFSTDFPVTPGVIQGSCTCSSFPDAFITEFNPSGSALVYSTYLGGSNLDIAYAIALDSANDAYITGYTVSDNFPTTGGAFQTTIAANAAGFVAKLNPTATVLLYSTYLGGSTSITTTPCETCATSIAVDESGSAYVTGLTAEANFPITPGAFQSVFKSSPQGHDGFITKLNSTGTGLVYSTFLGGSGDDGGTGISLDSSNNVWIKGNTKSTDFPVTSGAFQTVSGGNFDVFVSELDPTGSSLLYSTYLGGSGAEFGGATRMLALDQQTPPNIYVTGYTDSTNFPTTAGALQTGTGGINDVFVAKFGNSSSSGVGLNPISLTFTGQNDGTTSPAQTLTLTNGGAQSLHVTGISITGANSHDFAETSSCGTLAANASCTISVRFTPTLVGTESATVSVTDDAANSPQTASLSGTGQSSGGGPSDKLSPSSLTFGTQLVGTSSVSQIVTLTNVGSGALTISKLAISGDFKQTSTCGSSLAAGASCTMTVTFSPTTTNTRSGAITLTDNAAGSPHTVSLTGTGTFAKLSPISLTFAALKVGRPSTAQKITLTNTAKTALTVNSVTVTGANSGDFKETNTCGTRVNQAANCTISVTFEPLATGSRSANISISDTGGGSPQTVKLTGTGQ